MKREMNMSTAKLIRGSGLISILAGGLYALGALLHPVGEDLAAYTSPKWVPAHQVYWVAAMLMLFGLVGLYARQVEQTGWLGLVGLVVLRSKSRRTQRAQMKWEVKGGEECCKMEQ
jgi:hypothetical protein